ncbi:LOW QUALITY PROTEIN: uncharacterized protein LOC124286888 [Haliotis rubra]|uniref:LOW QUALITY PROTEIN: uncharacterized protein LOC124286888 n=1 Tax=Haliotis rubra TaxID=36100 RepID=UPI001EE52CD1|nr:LOW QUALITY PROTEIN: uncharacterized protein LOC124286888 [Haliotis rubra]
MSRTHDKDTSPSSTMAQPQSLSPQSRLGSQDTSPQSRESNPFRKAPAPASRETNPSSRESPGSRGGSSWGIMAHVYERVLHIINKPPTERGDSEIDTILPWFRKKAELFKELKTEILLDIVRQMSAIIRQGDKGDKFYIILTGTVSVHINTNLVEDDFESIKQKQLDEEANVIASEGFKSLDRSKYGTYMAKIPAGKSFGELALIRADSVRNATIIADETTDLLMVNRDLYNRSLHAYQAQEFEKKYGFVDDYPLFSGWNPRYKRMVAMSLVKRSLKFEDTVIKQDTSVDGLHFIISGQVKIVVDPSLHPVQYPTLFPKGDIAALEREKARELLRREMNLEKSKAVDKKVTYQKRKQPQQDGKKTAIRHLELCLMGAVDVIGDLEMALGLSTYAESVICTQEAEVYQLDQRNYDRLIERRNPNAIKLMKNIVHTKLSLHFSRLSEEKLPLFRYFLYTLDEKEKRDNQTEQTAASEKPNEPGWKVASLQKGPLVNLFGPGSVFYMIRMREKEKKRRTQRPKQFGGSKFGVTSQSKFTFGARALPEVGKSKANTQEDYGGLPHPEMSLTHNPFITEPGKTPTPTFQNAQFPPKITYQTADDDPEDLLQDATLFQVNDNKGRESTGSGQTLSPMLAEDADSGDEAALSIGDVALTRLEERIQAWHSSLDDPETRSAGVKRAVKLHRYQGVLQDERKPRPGNKVHMRMRDTTRSVAFYTYRCDDDDVTSDVDVRNRAYSTMAGSPMSSTRIYDLVSEVDPNPESNKKLRKSAHSSTGRNSRRRFVEKKPKKQYTVEEYMALKEELRRRQIQYRSFLPQRTSYTVF